MSQGRRVPEHPSYTTSAGYTVRVRRISPDTPARLQAAAMRELAGTRPPVPTERTAIGEDPRTKAPVYEDVPRPDDPEYLAAFAAWEHDVRRAASRKLVELLRDYAIVTETDDSEVQALRDAHAALGDTSLETESDRDVWLFQVVAPAQEDINGLMAFILGRSIPTQEAIQAQKDTFPGPAPAA